MNRWQDRAACRDTTAAWFDSDAHPALHTMVARAYCSDCPVRQACYDKAAADPYATGVWGGAVWQQRKVHRKQTVDV